MLGISLIDRYEQHDLHHPIANQRRDHVVSLICQDGHFTTVSVRPGDDGTADR